MSTGRSFGGHSGRGIQSLAHPSQTYAGARLSVSLLASGRGIKRILLTVAGFAEVRPREAVTEKWPSLVGFCRFRPQCRIRVSSITGKSRKQRKPTKGWEAKLGRLSAPTHLHRTTLSDCMLLNHNGREAAGSCEAQTPSNLTAPAEGALCCNNGCE